MLSLAVDFHNERTCRGCTRGVTHDCVDMSCMDYVRGNDTCPGVYADLKLKPRQELISVVRAMLEPVEDLVQLDIAFEDNMVG